MLVLDQHFTGTNCRKQMGPLIRSLSLCGVTVPILNIELYASEV